HLHSSYNRIRFKFPIRNPMLDETKYKHESLYKIIKSIIENEENFPLNQNWSWDKILRSCFIKQADVLQGIYYFGNRFTKEEK
ncbi:PRD domain-containing protein, partial [Clostridioides difficile]|uniref:PRD domain-containing protein n=1 Tax=Clostridioides difficile TaxID=1496 RepID=UPI001EEF39E1